MAISDAYSGSMSISTTETSLLSASTSLQSSTIRGVYQLFLDLSALTATEQYTLKIKEKTRSSSTQRLLYTYVFSGVQTDPIYLSASMLLLYGWDITLTKNAGTDRTIEWSIRQVA